MRTLCRRYVTIGIFIVLVVGPVTGCSQQRDDVSAVATSQPVAIQDALVEVAKAYNVTIEPLVKSFRWHYWFSKGYSADPPTAKEVEDYTPILIEEINRYPKDFFERIRLKRFVLCSPLLHDDYKINGFAFSSAHAIYLHIEHENEDGGGNRSEQWRRHTFHHELFHILDARDDNAFDAEWKALNPDSFQYGKASEQEMCGCRGRGGEGFLRASGKSSLGEDKALYFAYMVKHYAAVRDLAKRDPIVGKKTDLMKKIVADFYPKLDDEFWAEAQRRSDSPADRRVAAMRYGWVEVKAGVDPLHPDRQETPPFVLLRRTAFPGCMGFWSSAGRFSTGKVTKIDTEGEILIESLYNTTVARCVISKDLQDGHYDLIAAVPQDDPKKCRQLMLENVRKAFESTFALTVEKEKREVDVYVVKLSTEGTCLLNKAVKRLEQEQKSVKQKSVWQKLFGGKQKEDAKTKYNIMSGCDRIDDQWYFVVKNAPLGIGLECIEHNELDRPVINETGFTKAISVKVEHDFDDPYRQLQLLADALGLEIIPERRTVKMTVFKKRIDAS